MRVAPLVFHGLTAVLLLACSAAAAAQSSPARFVLGAGFSPDPQTGQGETGGDTDASRFGPQCSGWIGSAPHHTIQVTSALDLQLAVDSFTDSTLAVVGPGGVFCDDDSNGALDARVAARLTPGDYAVYVGHLGMPRPYTLTLTEGAADPLADTGGLYANFTLGAGFTPDPQIGTGTNGGDVQASTYGAHCTGMIDSTPDHVLSITSTVGLRLAVTSATDSSLVVTGAGKALCDDDSGGGLDPAIVHTFAPGEYAVYIGQQGEPGEYRLTISETL